MSRREDTSTNYPEDAAAYERWRGQDADFGNRPTRAELEAEEREIERNRRRAR